MRHLVFYSGGLASWRVAYDLHQQGKDVHLLFTDTYIEDKDLYRFLLEGMQIIYGIDLTFELNQVDKLPEPYEDMRKRKEVLHQISVTVMAACNKINWSGDNGNDVWDVFNNKNYLGNSRIAPCSQVIKQQLAKRIVKGKYDPDDTTLYLGIGWDEIHRASKPKEHWAPYEVVMPLMEEPYYTNDDHIDLLNSLGVRVPRLYGQKFAHNNCGGFCVRGGHGHFANLLANNPALYAYHEERERELINRLGKPVSILRKQIDGVKYHMTMQAFRELLESGTTDNLVEMESKGIDLLDQGGCGCMVDYREGEGE